VSFYDGNDHVWRFYVDEAQKTSIFTVDGVIVCEGKLTDFSDLFVQIATWKTADVYCKDFTADFGFLDTAPVFDTLDPIVKETTQEWDLSTFTPVENQLDGSAATIEWHVGVADKEGGTITWQGWDTAANIRTGAAKIYGAALYREFRIASTGGLQIGDVWDSPSLIEYTEVDPTILHRSVGTTATDLNTDSRTVNITGSLAVFSDAMPDIVGNGCVLQYDITGTKYLAFIEQRYTDTIFGVQDKDGSTPQATGAGQAVNVYRTYTSLSNFEDVTENTNIDATVRDFDTTARRNLVGNNERIKVACYADGLDNTAVNFATTWKTNRANYVYIYTPVEPSEVGVSQRHKGKWTAANEAYTLEGTAGSAIAIGGIGYIEIEGLQIFISAAASQFDYCIQDQALLSKICCCIVKDTGSGDNRGGIRILQTAQVDHCLAYDFDTTGSFGFYGKDGNGADAAIFDNCTAVDCAIGFDVGTAGEMRCRNCGAVSCTNGFDGTFHADSDYNASDIAGDAPGAHSYNEVTPTMADKDNDDFHLARLDTAWRNKGQDLGLADYCGFSPEKHDIDWQVRTGLWDIGADQYVEPYDYPSEDDVEDGVEFGDGAYEGNFGAPGEGEVKKDVGYGSEDTEFTGTLESTDPGEANVLKDVAYIIESVAKTGTFDEASRNTDPGEANVIKDIAYKILNVAKVGTFDEAARNTDPGVGNVIKDIAYKILNVAKVGTFDEASRNSDPGVSNVIKDVAYKIYNEAKTGTFDEAARNTDPGIGNVLKDVAYKILDIAYTGTFDESARNTDPGIGNVVRDINYKILDVAKIGTFDETARNTDPGEVNVKLDTLYKILGVDKTGELAIPEVPAEADVEDGVTYGINGTEFEGKFEAPAESDVAIGVGYGANGTEFTGAFEGTPPSASTLVMTDQGDGTGATATISGEDDDTTNTLWVMASDESAFASKGAFSGATMDVELATGLYFAYIRSVGPGGATQSTVAVFTVTDSANCEIITLADAVKDELNAGAFSQDFTAVRGYLERKKLEEMSDVYVLVNPTARVETEPGSRDIDRNTYRINVTILKKISSKANAQVDPLITLTDEIYRHFRIISIDNNALGEQFFCQGVENEPLYGQDELKESSLYRGVISLFFRTVS